MYIRKLHKNNTNCELLYQLMQIVHVFIRTGIIITMVDSTYIHNTIEVKCTGRVATKKKGNRSNGQQTSITLKLFEITPVDSEEGTWTTWVKLEDLYKIMEDE